MRITAEIFAAYLNCPTKCFLRLHNESVGYSEFSEYQARNQAEFEIAGLARMCSSFPANGVSVGNPPLPELRSCRDSLIVGYEAVALDIQSRLHALQRTEGKAGECDRYVPVRLVWREKLNALDRLHLAFDAVAISPDLGQVPHIGKLVHGKTNRTSTVNLDPWIKQTRRALSVIRKYESPSAAPPLFLNSHCSECEFEKRCHQLAVEQDDIRPCQEITRTS